MFEMAYNMAQTNTVKKEQVSLRKLQNWIAAYNQYTEFTEAPRDFHSWTAISTIAGAMGRSCWIDMGVFKMYPSFYIILVAPPGIATKSTTAGVGMSLLKESNAINIFQGSITWQAIVDELEQATKMVTVGGKQLETHPLHMFASELGVLFKQNDAGMIDMLVDIWDGKDDFSKRTKGSGMVVVPRPYINLLACTTPAWLSQYAESYFIEGGFFSRTLFVYADKKDKLIAYPENTLDLQLKNDLIHDLKRIAEMKGEFTLTPEAKIWGTEWYERLYRNPPEHLKGEKFQSYISRRQSHLHKTAMVLSAAESNDMEITETHLQLAEALLELAEENLSTIHTSIVTSDKLQAYNLVCRYVKAEGTIDKSRLFFQLSNRITKMEFEEGVSAAIFARQVKQVQKGSDQLVLAWIG